MNQNQRKLLDMIIRRQRPSHWDRERDQRRGAEMLAKWEWIDDALSAPYLVRGDMATNQYAPPRVVEGLEISVLPCYLDEAKRAVGDDVLVTALMESWEMGAVNSPEIVAGVKVMSLRHLVLTKLEGDNVTDLGDLQRMLHGADTGALQQLITLSDEAW